MAEKRAGGALIAEWPHFTTYIGTIIGAHGPQMKIAVTYRGETREKLFTFDEWERVTGYSWLKERHWGKACRKE